MTLPSGDTSRAAARHPVITGVGIVAATGSDPDQIWSAFTANASGLRPLSLFQSPRYGQTLVGQVSGDLLSLGAPRRGSRSDRLAWLAAREALRSARGNFQMGGENPPQNPLTPTLSRGEREKRSAAEVGRLSAIARCGADKTSSANFSNPPLPLVEGTGVREALEQFGIPESHREQTGIILGCSVGGCFDSERFLITLMKRGKVRPLPTRFHECVSAVDLIAEEFGLFGPSTAVATACSSGALAIATAAEMIQSGEANAMLAGGADSLSRMTWGGFHSLLLVDGTGCRPFDLTRSGMSLGEGAAFLVLEEEEFARRRGATILARLTGWGATCDAYHPTAPHPEGEGAVAAMQSALDRAGLSPSSVDYINAHGTGTRENDLAEAKALRTVFGQDVPPFSSTKRFFGHALAASGAIEAVVCVEALRRQQVPPNSGFAQTDPAIALRPATELRDMRLTHVMSNSFGFGGNNAVLIFSTPEFSPHTQLAVEKPAGVTGVGVIGPGSLVEREIEAPLPPGKVMVHACGPVVGKDTLTANQRRRLSRINQMCILAARSASAPDPSPRVGVAMGTGFGCLEDGAIFIENLIAKDEAEPMPSRFPGSVHNAPAGNVAMDLGARGMNFTPTAGEISFEWALWQAKRQLDAGAADIMLAGAIDELNKYPLAIGQRWGFWQGSVRPGEGVAVVRLTSTHPAQLAQLTTVRLGRYRRPFDPAHEVTWIASQIDLSRVDVLFSGAGGWPALEGAYQDIAGELSARAGRSILHLTYKQFCGEFHSASAFGFSRALDWVKRNQRGALLYTLSMGGGKALSCLQP